MPLPLFPYQEEGAEWIARRERAGLFDEMGIGKTAQAVRAIDLRRLKRGLVICPAMLRENWRGEFLKFSHFQHRIVKIQNVHDFVAWSRERFDIGLISYDHATTLAKYIHDKAEIFDFCVIDESHYVKNLDTQRGRAVLGKDGDGNDGIVQYAEQSWLLTGTPMANDPVDIYPFLRFSRAMPLSKSAFCARYFVSRASTYSTRNKPKPEAVDELQALIANNSIRRTQKEVGLQLPPIFLTTTLVDGDTQNIRDLLLQHPGLEQEIINALERGGLRFIDAAYVSTLRRLIGEAKAIPYAEMLREELEASDHKYVVFGNSRNALLSVRDYLCRHGFGAVLVAGDTREKERQHNVLAFQSNEQCRVFIGNIRAAGVGLTLTASCRIDILEADWSPAGNAQAIKRVHRIGQTNAVHGRFITLAKSFDEVVNRIVVEKTANIAAIDPALTNAAPEDLTEVA